MLQIERVRWSAVSMDLVARETSVGGNPGGVAGAPILGRWLSLAATPAFALMAAWTAVPGAHSNMLCVAMHGSSLMSGMAFMYLMMSVFHSSPWLALIARWRSGARRHTCPHPKRNEAVR